MRFSHPRPLRAAVRHGVVPFRAIGLLLAAALISACAGATPASSGAPSAQVAGSPTAPATSTPGSSAVAAFPLRLTDDEGRTVDLAAEPRAIVSLTPAVTETLYALGVGDRLVGKVEDFTLYPPEAAAVPDVAHFGSIDVEQIVALGADLVIAGGNNFNPPDQVERLRSLGIPVLTIYGPSLEAALQDLVLVGEAVGRSVQAAELVAGLEAVFSRVRTATSTTSRPRVYYELDATNGYFGPAPDYFGTEMIRLAGGDPLTSGAPGAFQIPEEQIIAFDPQVILLGDAAYGVTPEQVASRPAWSGLSAVVEGAIRPVDDVIVTRPGPRLGQGLLALARAIHPTLALPPAGP
jgi:iron complex transport system substrate-binding protein